MSGVILGRRLHNRFRRSVLSEWRRVFVDISHVYQCRSLPPSPTRRHLHNSHPLSLSFLDNTALTSSYSPPSLTHTHPLLPSFLSFFRCFTQLRSRKVARTFIDGGRSAVGGPADVSGLGLGPGRAGLQQGGEAVGR